MTVGGDLLGLDLGDRLGGAEERLGGGHIAGLTEIDVDQSAVAIDRPVQLAPCAGDLDVGFIDVPAPADLASPALAQALGEQRCQLGLPVAHRLVGEHEAADQEHLRSYVSTATDTSFSEATAEAMISFCYQEDADYGGTACCRGVEG